MWYILNLFNYNFFTSKYFLVFELLDPFERLHWPQILCIRWVFNYNPLNTFISNSMVGFVGKRHPFHAKQGYFKPNMTRLHPTRYSLKSRFRPFQDSKWSHLRANSVTNCDDIHYFSIKYSRTHLYTSTCSILWNKKSVSCFIIVISNFHKSILHHFGPKIGCFWQQYLSFWMHLNSSTDHTSDPWGEF